METRRLISMANQIGTFFESSYGSDEAARPVAQHLKSFWVPAMRRELIEYRRQSGAGLTKVVSEALEILENEQRSEHSTT